MPSLELFPREKIVGVFRGFREGGLEFHADLVLPYRPEFQSIPMHGQYLLVQLETPDEAVLGRISSLSAEGKFTSSAGEEFNIRAVGENRMVPEDLREQYLRYRVNMRVLGVLRVDGGTLVFVPSHRRLPHVGSPIAFLSPDVLREVAGHNVAGADLGYLALGEYIYAGSNKQLKRESWMQIVEPEVRVKFPVTSLVSRRSFVFARAGFGKSNLIKLLLSNLYTTQPQIEKRGGRRVPVGTVIFDPDGEYFWPDDKGRPGLCDVPELHDRLAVFTQRKAPSEFYESFVAGRTKLDLRGMKATHVVGLALGAERQQQQNVLKLRGLNDKAWSELIDLVAKHDYDVSDEDLKRILKVDGVEIPAARSNIVRIVRQFHDSNSQFMDTLKQALKDGKLCVVDLSQMRGQHGLVLSSLVLRTIFEHNQDEFTGAEPQTIPTIAIIEEAQSVLDDRDSASSPFVEWVKEGRKYDLGAVLVTQQPGSIHQELLSQGDNWFVFHLLSASDLMKLKQANAHFSDDLLSSLLNEPIQGHGVFWSSAGGKPYPVAIRALSFEDRTRVQDPNYSRDGVDVYARKKRGSLLASAQRQRALLVGEPAIVNGHSKLHGQQQQSLFGSEEEGSRAFIGSDKEQDGDITEIWLDIAAAAVANNSNAQAQLHGQGMPWGAINKIIEEALPADTPDRKNKGFKLSREAMNRCFGSQGESWHIYKHPATGKNWLYVGPLRDSH